MMEPLFDVVLDIIFFRWLWSGDDDRSTVRSVVEVLVLLLIVLFIVGVFVGWWW
jgi:hypothetical protein